MTIYNKSKLNLNDALHLIMNGKSFPIHYSDILYLHTQLGCGCTHCYKEVIKSLADDYNIPAHTMHEDVIISARECGKMSDEEIEELDKFMLIFGMSVK